MWVFRRPIRKGYTYHWTTLLIPLSWIGHCFWASTKDAKVWTNKARWNFILHDNETRIFFYWSLCFPLAALYTLECLPTNLRSSSSPEISHYILPLIDVRNVTVAWLESNSAWPWGISTGFFIDRKVVVRKVLLEMDHGITTNWRKAEFATVCRDNSNRKKNQRQLGILDRDCMHALWRDHGRKPQNTPYFWWLNRNAVY